jgi:hypothetical protein
MMSPRLHAAHSLTFRRRAQDILPSLLNETKRRTFDALELV